MLGSRRLGTLAVAMLLAAAWSPGSAESGAFLGAGWDDAAAVGADSASFVGAMASITADVIDADAYWSAGHDGSGIDIAMIDTGVVPVAGLEGRISHGPDFSLDATFPNLETMDSFGHGTHLAGIAVGNPSGSFVGVAPGADVVNVKVGSYNGAVDVSQVIEAVDWVIANRNTDGRNVRVLLLAYGTDGTQNPKDDPLSYAVERAWHAGIVVVVAAGNDGNKQPVRNPATNNYVITVGATDMNGTVDTGDDSVADYSVCGTHTRSPDLVAPGSSVVSLRVPGSYIDTEYPQARVGSDYFLGSGTSQAAAMVAGAAALVLDANPNATPDQIKHHLVATGERLQGSQRCQGGGQLDLASAFNTELAAATAGHATANGQGSLEQARGTYHLTYGPWTLEGEVSLFEWEPYLLFLEQVAAAISSGPWSGNSWGGNSWGGNSWGGNSWGGNSWGGNSWGGNSWGANSWS